MSEKLINVNNFQELKFLITKHGCFSEEENLNIFEKCFKNGPRYLFKAVNKKYKITSKVLCDIGCSYGTNLIYCLPGSYGIEIDSRKVSFAKSIGLKVYQRDFLKDDISDLPKVEVIWCSAVLEHVESPYIFLIKIHHILNPGGLLIIYVPTIPLFPQLSSIPWIKKYISGFNNKDHINAFIPSTLKFICERAGFYTVEISPFYPNFFSAFNRVPVINRLVGRVVYIGQKK